MSDNPLQNQPAVRFGQLAREFVKSERRPPELVELREMLRNALGRAGSLTVAESEEILRAIREEIECCQETDTEAHGRLREVLERIFHQFPNRYNASPS